MRKIFLLTLFGFLATAPVRAQEIKSPAELMPAKVAYYAEVRQPGALAKEIGRLVEGSALGNVPESLQKIRAKHEKSILNRRFEELGAAGLFLSPEVIKELQGVQGAAVAFTGIGPQGEPEFAAVVLPGQSNVPHFMMRAFLANQRVRQVDTVEGVALFRMYTSGFFEFRPVFKEEKKEDKPPPPQVHEYGPVFAQTQGLIVLGSSDLVKDVIRRAKGKGQGPTLAKDKTFQDASESVGNKPGLFAYASGPNLASVIQGNGALFGPVQDMVLNMARSWKSVVWNLSLEQGSFHYREVATLDPQIGKQVMELLPAKGVDPKLFQYAPRDAILAGGLANPDGEKRLGKLLDMVDQAVPPIQGKKVSELLKDLETQFGISLGKDFVGPITDLGFALGDPTKATVRRIEEKGPNFNSVRVTTEVPLVFLVQAVDETAAKNLSQLVPKIFGLLGNEGEPKAQTIGGLEIRTIKGRRGEEVSYGQHGRVLVIGPYAGPVAMSLLAGSKQQGLSADAKLASRLKDMDDPILVLLMKPVGSVMGGLMTGGSHGAKTFATKKAEPRKFEEKKFEDKKFEEKKFEEKKFEGQRFEAQPGDKEEPAGQGTRTEVVNPPRPPHEERIMKEFGQILTLEDWFVLGVTRKDDRLVVDGKVAGLDRVVARLIDFAVEETFRNAAEFEERRSVPGGVGGLGGGKEVFSINDRLTAKDPPDRIRQGCPAKLHVFKMEEGHTYTIDLVSHKADFFDNYLRLEDSAGNNLAQDDDSGGDLNARIVFRPMRTDNYRIIATSFAGGTGSYSLTIRKRDGGDDKK